jgi:hypothetical protein
MVSKQGIARARLQGWAKPEIGSRAIESPDICAKSRDQGVDRLHPVENEKSYADESLFAMRFLKDNRLIQKLFTPQKKGDLRSPSMTRHHNRRF